MRKNGDLVDELHVHRQDPVMNLFFTNRTSFAISSCSKLRVSLLMYAPRRGGNIRLEFGKIFSHET